MANSGVTPVCCRPGIYYVLKPYFQTIISTRPSILEKASLQHALGAGSHINTRSLNARDNAVISIDVIVSPAKRMIVNCIHCCITNDMMYTHAVAMRTKATSVCRRMKACRHICI